MQKAYLSSFGSRVLRGVLLCLMVLALLAGARTASLGQVGQVWAWGDNGYGELGDGSQKDRTQPVQVANNLSGVVQLAVGCIHTIALKSDGTVWTWGYNFNGQLGDGTNTHRYRPVQITSLKGIVQVTAGNYHSVALKSDGTVWAWGYNGYGQLGDNTTTSTSAPIQVKDTNSTSGFLQGVVQVTAGGYHGGSGSFESHTLALKSDGTVWGWGANHVGQLGDNTKVERHTPIQASNLSGIVQVAAGTHFSVALKFDGTIWTWGHNDSGQLGDGTNANNPLPTQIKNFYGVVQVAGGTNHSLALKSDGTVWAWGRNVEGELGDGTNTDRRTPTQTLSDVMQVVAVGYSTLTVKSDGTVWAWGYNSNGQLGDGTSTNKPNPIQSKIIAGQTYLATGSASFHSLSVQAVVLNTTLKPANVTIVYGKSFTLSTTLKNSLGGVLINEPVAFMVDGTNVGTANTDASGKAILLVPASLDRHPGTYPITVSYAGNRLYAKSSKDATLTITKADIVISVGTVIGTPGVTKTLTATLKSKSDGSALSTRTLKFKIDGNAIGTASTDGTGKATLSYKFDESYAVGAHKLTAEYDGSADADYNSGKGTGTLTVNQAASKTVGSSLVGKAGSTVTLVAVLTRTSDKAALAGRTVSFAIDGVTVGRAVTDSDGFALLDYAIPATATTGLHPLAAVFKGDTFYVKSSDGAVWLKVR